MLWDASSQGNPSSTHVLHLRVKPLRRVGFKNGYSGRIEKDAETYRAPAQHEYLQAGPEPEGCLVEILHQLDQLQT
jgi:hypothetical protein